MNKPFKLTMSDGYANAHIGVCQHDDPDNRLYDFIQVKPLDVGFDYQLNYEVLTLTKIIQRYDVVWINTPNRILLSSKALEILNQICPEQIQTLDAVIHCKDGVVDTYKAINILNEVDVSDHEKSKYTYFDDGEIQGYEWGGFVMKDQPMEPIHIARDAKFHPSIIISATLKEAFEKAKIKGCQCRSGDEG